MAIHNVSTNSELLNAFAIAAPGDEIIGAAGSNLGDLTLSGRNFASYVRLTSADPFNRCVLTHLNLSNCSYIDVDGVALTYTYQTGDVASFRPFSVINSHHMMVHNCVNTGGMGPSGYGTGEGFFWQNVDDWWEEDNYTTGYRKASNHVACNRGSVRRNEFYNIRLDAMNFAEVQDLDIEHNYIHDHRADPNSTEHRDGIQFHSNNKTIQCKRVNIRYNRIDIGDGDWTQCILVNNEAVNSNGAGVGMIHEDFVIEENLLYCRHHHAITAESCARLTIRKNTIVQAVPNLALAHNQNRTNGTEDPQINVGGQFNSSVTIDSNVTTGISNTAGFTVTNNVIVNVNQGQDYTTSYENIKTVSGSQANPVANDWTVKLGGQVDLAGAGVTDMAAPGNGGGGTAGTAMPPPTLASLNVPVDITVV